MTATTRMPSCTIPEALLVGCYTKRLDWDYDLKHAHAIISERNLNRMQVHLHRASTGYGLYMVIKVNCTKVKSIVPQ